MSLAYARQLKPDAINILSAEHGLISLSQILAPYDHTLLRMTPTEASAWGQRVLRRLSEVCDPQGDHFTIIPRSIACNNCRRHLTDVSAIACASRIRTEFWEAPVRD